MDFSYFLSQLPRFIELSANIELYIHTWFHHEELKIFVLVRLKNVLLSTSTLTLWAPIPQNGQTLKQLPTNSLSVFDHFVGLALKGLIKQSRNMKFERKII